MDDLYEALRPYRAFVEGDLLRIDLPGNRFIRVFKADDEQIRIYVFGLNGGASFITVPVEDCVSRIDSIVNNAYMAWADQL